MHIPSDISSPFPCVIDFLTSFRLSVDTAPGSLAPAASGLTWTCSPPWEGRATPSTRLVCTGLRLPHSEALKPQQVAKTWALGPDALGSEFDYHSLDVWPMAVTSQRLHFYSCLKGWRIEWDSSWKAFSPRACQMALVVKNPPAHAGDVRDVGLIPWVRKIPWRRLEQPTLLFLPGESHRQRSLVGYSPQGCKELDTTEVT